MELILKNDSNENHLLENYTQNTYTQCGEDGIISHILEVIGKTDNYCVEFGAWDGTKFSNTRNLILNKNYSAVLIEGNYKRYLSLVKTYSTNQNVTPVHALVGFNENNSLDILLAKLSIPKNFDVLSIDIDGNDYHAWKSIKNYKPKVVIIEFNPTIPNEVEFVQKPDMRLQQGSSILSICKLGKTKGYELAAATLLNAIFVDSDLFNLFGISDNSLHALRKNLSAVTHLFYGYDGTVFISGSKNMMFHGLPFNERRLQQLPKILRIFSGNYGFFRKLFWHIFHILRKFHLL
jgi:hypothetical protein